MTARSGSGGGFYVGGTGGNNQLTMGAGSGNVTFFGGGSGDVLSATGGGSALFVGGSGAETLTGAGSGGSNTFFAGTGDTLLIGGSGNATLVAGSGAETLVGGSGLTLFAFSASRTSGATDFIGGFDGSHDFVQLANYATGKDDVLANASVFDGSTVLSLSDGTHVVFVGTAGLSASSFI